MQYLRQRFLFSDTRMHDLYYTREYYQNDVMQPAAEAAQYVADDFVENFHPESAIDVGCGTGEYMLALRDCGVVVHGVDLATAALAVCRERKLDIQEFDLTRGGSLPWQAELVYSFEVAEHLPPSEAGKYVSTLCRAARRIIAITAARPGQDGLGHQNCQPKTYWIKLFADQGFIHDADLTETLERRYRALGLAPWLYLNLMIFRR